ncbi:hypothetical protein [Frigidibacter sp.]|uniref:hypothetical protein n=1 Tax=Frigidibacter sp. TaxID=2586418 RepID=UPI00273377B3|nr:hypothetical protein [Frigidibacter sp.]MDP3339409.1 hypothetical protein [Frigidibacter sp.]
MTGPPERRVLILGNSHIAAVKAAYGSAPDRWPGLAVQFAGGHGDALAALQVQGGRLVPQTEAARDNLQLLNRREAWSLADYDAFVVVGCEVGIYRALVPYRSARFLGLSPGAAAAVPVSRAMFDLAVRDQVTQSLGGALALRILAGVQVGGQMAQVMLAEQPRPSFDCRRNRRRFTGLLRAHRLGDGAVLAEVFEAAARAALPGITWLAQPEDTRHGGVFTQPRYSVGSVRLMPGNRRVAHSEDDFIHANAEYGALVLDQIAAAVP